jgi:hypothetical protein
VFVGEHALPASVGGSANTKPGVLAVARTTSHELVQLLVGKLYWFTSQCRSGE